MSGRFFSDDKIEPEGTCRRWQSHHTNKSMITESLTKPIAHLSEIKCVRVVDLCGKETLSIDSIVDKVPIHR